MKFVVSQLPFILFAFGPHELPVMRVPVDTLSNQDVTFVEYNSSEAMPLVVLIPELVKLAVLLPQEHASAMLSLWL